jgi:hypothetical protein
VEVVVALAERRVYIRGDMQSKQGRFSTSNTVEWKQSERRHKMSDKNMVLLWIDGNPVHFRPDGTVKNEVTRRRQTRKKSKYLHQTIQQRNAQWTGMTNCAAHFHLPVDMVSKKYYVKIILGWWIWHW